MSNRILPRALKEGDVIGVVSPSFPAGLFPRRLKRGISYLESMGFRVRVGRHASDITDHTAGDPSSRVADIHEMFKDPDVAAIVTTLGGYNSNQLLDLLNFELIKANPKIFVGYSDASALFVAIWKETGIGCMLGPAILPQFGEFNGLHEFTATQFRNILSTASPPGELFPSNVWITERLEWDKCDNRARIETPHAGPRIVRHGEAEGPIIAANLGTLLTLAGTQFWPDLDGVVLLVEDDEIESPGSIDRYLTHMRHLGVFDKIAGLGIGRFHSDVGLDSHLLDRIVLRATRDSTLPILADLDFGHVDPMLILPYGAQARLSAEEHARLFIIEAAVR